MERSCTTSPVICDYLNTLADGALIPAGGPGRWDTLRRQALGDGVLDNALPMRGELQRVESDQAADTIARYRDSIERALDSANRDPATVQSGPFDLGAIAIACALGWLDFRLPQLAWRTNRPQLAAWFEGLAQRASLSLTQPTGSN